MADQKRHLGLRLYPEVDRVFHMYINEIGQNLMNELSPLLRLTAKEPVSEGGEEVIQRLDGSKATMTFNEVNVPGSIATDALLNSRFDELISSIFQVAREMGNTVERSLLNAVSAAAEEAGNVFRADIPTVDTICEILERVELTFNEAGEMDQIFVISPHLSERFQQIMSDPRVLAIIDRKRREYFAKKGD